MTNEKEQIKWSTQHFEEVLKDSLVTFRNTTGLSLSRTLNINYSSREETVNSIKNNNSSEMIKNWSGSNFDLTRIAIIRKL